METTEPVVFGILDAINTGFDVVGDSITIFTQEPAIYFVGLALIGAGAGVAKRFVPMKRR